MLHVDRMLYGRDAGSVLVLERYNRALCTARRWRRALDWSVCSWLSASSVIHPVELPTVERFYTRRHGSLTSNICSVSKHLVGRSARNHELIRFFDVLLARSVYSGACVFFPSQTTGRVSQHVYCSGGSSLNFFGGPGPMTNAVREPITGVWGRSPQWGPGAEPLVRGSGAKPGGEAPWSWNIFSFWTFTGTRKFVHFSKIWKRKKITDICVVFAKMKLRYGTD